MAVNRERLIRLAEWLGAQQARMDLGLPSEWDQADWLIWKNGELQEATGCGTACCIAGKVALEDGGVPLADVWDAASKSWHFRPLDESEVGDSSIYVRLPDGGTAPVDFYAQQQLGLTGDQADVLFAGSNTYDRCMDAIRQILSGDLE